MLIWIVAMIILFYLYWKKGRFEAVSRDAKAIEQKVIAATGKIYCPKCATQMDSEKQCTNCGYDPKTPLTAGQAPTPTITTAASASATNMLEFEHGFKIRGHGGLIDDLPQTLLPPSLAGLKNNGNGKGTKDQAVPQTPMKDPAPPATAPATPKKDEPTLDQLVDQRIATLPSMDTGKLIALKTEVDTQVETYQAAVSELNTELGPYRRLQKATTRNLITNLVKDGAIDLNANPELKSLVNTPPEGSRIIDTSKSLPADPSALSPQPALAPATPDPPKSEPAPDLSSTATEPQEQAADQTTTAIVSLQESEAEGISPIPPAEEPSGESSEPMSGEPTELGNTEPITNVKKPKSKGGRSRKRKRQEQSPPEEPKDTEPQTHETALSSGSSQQLVVQTFEKLDEQSEQPTNEETQSESAPEEHGEEFADTGFFVSQHSDTDEGSNNEDEEGSNSDDEAGS